MKRYTIPTILSLSLLTSCFPTEELLKNTTVITPTSSMTDINVFSLQDIDEDQITSLDNIKATHTLDTMELKEVREDLLKLINDEECSNEQTKVIQNNLTEAHKESMGFKSSNNLTEDTILIASDEVGTLSITSKDEKRSWKVITISGYITDIVYSFEKESNDYSNSFHRDLGLISKTDIGYTCSLAKLMKFDCSYRCLQQQPELLNSIDIDDINIRATTDGLIQIYDSTLYTVILSYSSTESIGNLPIYLLSNIYDHIYLGTIDSNISLDTECRAINQKILESIKEYEELPYSIYDIKCIVPDNIQTISITDFIECTPPNKQALGVYYYKSGDKILCINYKFRPDVRISEIEFTVIQGKLTSFYTEVDNSYTVEYVLLEPEDLQNDIISMVHGWDIENDELKAIVNKYSSYFSKFFKYNKSYTLNEKVTYREDFTSIELWNEREMVASYLIELRGGHITDITYSWFIDQMCPVSQKELSDLSFKGICISNYQLSLKNMIMYDLINKSLKDFDNIPSYNLANVNTQCAYMLSENNKECIWFDEAPINQYESSPLQFISPDFNWIKVNKITAKQDFGKDFEIAMERILAYYKEGKICPNELDNLEISNFMVDVEDLALFKDCENLHLLTENPLGEPFGNFTYEFDSSTGEKGTLSFKISFSVLSSNYQVSPSLYV